MSLVERPASGTAVRLQDVSSAPGHDKTRSRLRQPADAIGLAAAVAILALLLFAAHSLPAGSAELTANAASSFRHVPRVFVFACAVVTSAAPMASMRRWGLCSRQ
jgi:hypothetical protein